MEIVCTKETIDLWCYYNNADEVELFVNGKSPGVKKKSLPPAPSPKERADDGLCTEFHVAWRVQFEPGEVKTVSRKNGQTVCEQVIKTAGAPHHIRLSVDYAGRDLTFVNAEVVDADGNLCPWAENQIILSGDGNMQVVATDNGCQTSMERFTSPQRKAFFGKCMVVVRGKGTLKAQAYNLQQAELML